MKTGERPLEVTLLGWFFIINGLLSFLGDVLALTKGTLNIDPGFLLAFVGIGLFRGSLLSKKIAIGVIWFSITCITVIIIILLFKPSAVTLPFNSWSTTESLLKMWIISLIVILEGILVWGLYAFKKTNVIEYFQKQKKGSDV